MLTPDELDTLARDLLDIIEQRSYDMLLHFDEPTEQDVLTAAMEIEGGLQAVLPRVRRLIDDRALAAGMSQAAVGRARGQTRQSVNRRVNAR